jgi:hypothetical protein
MALNSIQFHFLLWHRRRYLKEYPATVCVFEGKIMENTLQPNLIGNSPFNKALISTRILKTVDENKCIYPFTFANVTMATSHVGHARRSPFSTHIFTQKPS